MKVEDMGFGLSPQGANINNQAMSAKESKRTLFFNFIMLRQINSQKFRVFSIIACCFTFFQNIFISFWPHLNLKTPITDKFDYIRVPPFYEDNLTNAFFFYSTNRSPKGLYIFSFIILFIVIVFFFISLFGLGFFYFRKIVNFPLLYCYNFFIQFICPIFTVPIGFQTGWLISKIIYLKELDKKGIFTDSLGSVKVYTIIVILDSILYAIIIIFSIFSNIYDSNSIIIVESYFVCYNGTFKSCLMIIPSFILLLSNVLPLFYSNFVHVVMALHMLYCVFMVVLPFWVPFGKLRMNSIICAYSISILISDIFCYTKLNTKWYRYIIFFSSFVIFYFLMDFFIKLRVKSIIKPKKDVEGNEEFEDLDNNQSKQSKSTPASQRYSLFGDPLFEPTGYEDYSIQKLLFILRLSIITKSHVFTDGKLVDLITQKVEESQDKIQLGRLICYFPDFQSIFFAIITGLKRARYLPYIQEFLLYQLRYHEICCHPESKIADIDEIVDSSTALSLHISSFWQIIDSECQSNGIAKTHHDHHDHHHHNNNKNNKNSNNNKKNISNNNSITNGIEQIYLDEEEINERLKLNKKMFSSFDRLSRSVNDCQSKWKALLSFYPNNIQIIDEYSIFLVECIGDFVGASEWKTISSLIKDGKTYKFSPVHVSFLRAFPNYAKEIFPKKPLIKGFDDIDIFNRIDNVSKLIEMPEVRFEFQRAVNSSFPFSIFVFLFISIASLIFIAVFWIYCMCSLGSFEHVLDSLSFITNISLLSQLISQNYIAAILDYGMQKNYDVSPTSDDIFNAIYFDGESDRIDDRTVLSLITLNDDYKPQIVSYCQEGMKVIDILHKATLTQILKGNRFQMVMNSFYNNESSTVYYLSANESINSSLNFQSLLISHFIYYHSLANDYNYSILSDPLIYHATQAGSYVIDILDEVSGNILINNQKILHEDDSFYTIILPVVSVAYIVVSCVLVWIDFIFIIKSFRSIVNSLYYFPKSVKLKASQSIVINNENINNDELIDIDETIISNIELRVRDFVLIALIFLTIINIAVAAGIFSFRFIYFRYKYNFVSISELVHFYSLETSQIIEVLHSLMAASTFGKIVPSVDSKYKEKLRYNLKKVLTTHQNCWGYSVRGDCDIKKKYITMINDLKNKEKCPDLVNKSYHELISCLSEESAFNAFVDLTDSLEDNINNDLLLKTADFKQYIHFILSHLYYDVKQFDDFLTLGFVDKQIDYANNIQLFGIISIFVACFIFILNLYVYAKVRDIFNLMFAFISRILPSDFVNNSRLLNSLLGIKNMNKNSIENSETSFLVRESSPIIFLDRSGLIEFVNNAFAHKFSYEANFIVGQPISVIIEDESTLFYIDTLKFFESRKTAVKTIFCKKGNGNKTLFDISFIPIHITSKEKLKEKINKATNAVVATTDVAVTNNNTNDVEQEKDPFIINDNNDDDDDDNGNSFVNRIALIFTDKTSEKNIQKKCNFMKMTVDKIASQVFPDSFNLYCQGHLKLCAICLIKLSNSFQPKTSSNKILTQRQNLYDILYDRIQFYPLLMPLDCKNGIFLVVACKKNDPVELAIECLNFAFNVIEQFDDQLSKGSPSLRAAGPFFAVIETGGELTVGWSGDSQKRTIITGELMERGMKVLDNASLAGTICISNKTYEYLMQHDYVFAEREIPEEICGSKSIYAIENKANDFLALRHSKSASDSQSYYSSKSLSFVKKLKEDDIFQVQSDED